MTAALDLDAPPADRGRRRARWHRARWRRWSWRARTLAAVVVAAVAGLAFLLLAPLSIGGANGYMITDGISMLPTIQPGSVVVTRQESNYRVGEIVAYHNLELHTVVLHRLVGRDGSRYVFKGDNNTFPDIFEPTRSELVGKEIVDIPTLGRVLVHLRTPWLAAMIVGGVALWMLWDVGDARPGGAPSEDEISPPARSPASGDQEPDSVE